MFRKLFKKKNENLSESIQSQVERLKKDKAIYSQSSTMNNNLNVILGCDEKGENVYLDIDKLSSVLIYGSSGSGKSTFVNKLVVELMIKNNPGNLQMAFIDPKMVEFYQFKDSCFTLIDPISDMKKALQFLEKLNDIYNQRKQSINSNKNIKSDFKKIILVIDEYADLIMQCPHAKNLMLRLMLDCKEVNIHLLILTQQASNTNLDYIINYFDEKIFLKGMYADYSTYNEVASENDYHLIRHLPNYGRMIVDSTQEFAMMNYLSCDKSDLIINALNEKYRYFNEKNSNYNLDLLLKNQYTETITSYSEYCENLINNDDLLSRREIFYKNKTKEIYEIINNKALIENIKKIDANYRYYFLDLKLFEPNAKNYKISAIVYLDENTNNDIIKNTFNQYLRQYRYVVDDVVRYKNIVELKLINI